MQEKTKNPTVQQNQQRLKGQFTAKDTTKISISLKIRYLLKKHRNKKNLSTNTHTHVPLHFVKDLAMIVLGI